MERAETQVSTTKGIIYPGSKENHLDASKYSEMIEHQPSAVAILARTTGTIRYWVSGGEAPGNISKTTPFRS